MRFWYAYNSAESMDYLLSQDTETGILYHPPVPNVHNTGAVCASGRDTDPLPVRDPGEALVPWFIGRIGNWSQRSWNADLLGSTTVEGRERDLAAILSFDEATGRNVPFSGDWRQILPRVGPPPMISDPLGVWFAKYGRRS
jgi:hypothetical protein